MDDQLARRIDGIRDDGRSYDSYLVIGNRIMGWELLPSILDSQPQGYNHKDKNKLPSQSRQFNQSDVQEPPKKPRKLIKSPHQIVRLSPPTRNRTSNTIKYGNRADTGGGQDTQATEPTDPSPTDLDPQPQLPQASHSSTPELESELSLSGLQTRTPPPSLNLRHHHTVTIHCDSS